MRLSPIAIICLLGCSSFGQEPLTEVSQPQQTADSSQSISKTAEPFGLDNLPLQIQRVSTLQDYGQSTVLQVKCDAQGAVFINAIPKAESRSVGVVRISPDAKITPYLVRDITQAREAGNGTTAVARNFAVAPSGELYIIVTSSGAQRPRGSIAPRASSQNSTPGSSTQFIAVFATDGKFKKIIELEPKYYPSQIMVLPSGRMLIGGGKRQESGADPFLGLFDEDGVALREIKLRNRDSQPPYRGGVPLSQFTHGIAETGEDGNIYFMPSGTRSSVRVFSPYGEFVRTIKLKWPNDRIFLSMKMSGAFLAAEFANSTHCSTSQVKDELGDCNDTYQPRAARTLVVFDAATGRMVREFEAPNSLGRFACYSRESFTFLGNDPTTKQLQIVTAAAQ